MAVAWILAGAAVPFWNTNLRRHVIEFTHAVVSTLGKRGECVRMFRSGAEAIEWACEYVRHHYPEDQSLMAMPNGKEFLRVFKCGLPPTERFFGYEALFHNDDPSKE